MFGLSIVTAGKPSNEEVLRERNTKWILFFLFLIVEFLSDVKESSITTVWCYILYPKRKRNTLAHH